MSKSSPIADWRKGGLKVMISRNVDNPTGALKVKRQHIRSKDYDIETKTTNLSVCSQSPRKISKTSLGTSGRSMRKELKKVSEWFPFSIFSRYFDKSSRSHFSYEEDAGLMGEICSEYHSSLSQTLASFDLCFIVTANSVQ